MTEFDLIIRELQDEMQFSRDMQRRISSDKEIQHGFQMSAILERLHARREAMQRQGGESVDGKGGSMPLTLAPKKIPM